MDFKLAIDAHVILAETPIWDPRIHKLYWTDLVQGTVHRYDPTTGKDEIAETGSGIGTAIPTSDPRKLLVAIDDGIMLLDFPSGKLQMIASPQNNSGEFSYNDTRCDAMGRIFTSTVSKHYTDPDFDPEKMTGKFYMIDIDGAVVTLVDKVVQYNTIFFNNQNSALFVVDTFYKKVLRFDYSLKRGAFGDPEAIIEFDDMPDGASVDMKNNVYICHWGPEKRISVWNLDNYQFVKNIAFPVKHICCGGFAGEDMKDFYVATSKFWLPENDPDFKAGAGGIFMAKAEIPGTPERFYILR
jgi:sugar lactone lactonase YvrE